MTKDTKVKVLKKVGFMFILKKTSILAFTMPLFIHILLTTI